jgi:hypothetical protein
MLKELVVNLEHIVCGDISGFAELGCVDKEWLCNTEKVVNLAPFFVVE